MQLKSTTLLAFLCIECRSIESNAAISKKVCSPKEKFMRFYIWCTIFHNYVLIKSRKYELMVQCTEMPAEQIGFAYSFTERLFLFSKGKDAEVF